MEGAISAESELNVALRPLVVEDFHFLLSAWLKSYQFAWHNRNITDADYFLGQQNLISEITQRRRVIISADKDQPEYIFGFICGQKLEDERTLIDYVYVKKMYRKRGLARQLAAALGATAGTQVVATHITPAVASHLKRPYVTYNPFYNALGYSDV